MGLYVPPISEWERYPQMENKILLPTFEFPIEQEITKIGTQYIFETRYSNTNISNAFTIAFTPNYPIFLIPIVFFVCTYFTYISRLVKRDTKIAESHFTHREKSGRRKIIRGTVIQIMWSYFGALSISGISTLFGFSPMLEVIQELWLVTDHTFLLVNFVFPVLYISMFNYIFCWRRCS